MKAIATKIEHDRLVDEEIARQPEEWQQRERRIENQIYEAESHVDWADTIASCFWGGLILLFAVAGVKWLFSLLVG